jgi:hypothetical protein
MTFGRNFTCAETEAPALRSVSQQSESAKRVVKTMCAQAVPEVHKRSKNLSNTLQTEISKQKIGSNMNVALKYLPDLPSNRSIGNEMQADIWRLETERQSDTLPVLAEPCSRSSREPVVTAIGEKLPNHLLGPEQAISLCTVLSPFTGKSKRIFVNSFLI